MKDTIRLTKEWIPVIQTWGRTMTIRQMLEHVKVKESALAQFCARHGIKYVRQPMPKRGYPYKDRNALICARYMEGRSMAEVGTEFCVTRERVRQILVRNGIDKRFTKRDACHAKQKETFQTLVLPLYLEGYTINKALKKLGLTHHDIGQKKYADWSINPEQKHQHRKARFWRDVDKQENGCWLWTGSRNPVSGLPHCGYVIDGQVKGNAVGVAYYLAYGPIPKGKWITRTCSEICCVNPEHLIAATPKEVIAQRRPKPGVLSTPVVDELYAAYKRGVLIEELAVKCDKNPRRLKGTIRQRERRGLANTA